MEVLLICFYHYIETEAHDMKAVAASGERFPDLLEQKGLYVFGHCPFPGSVHLSYTSSLQYSTSDIRRYRTACENFILQDFEFALGKDAENRLWDAHGKVNSRFRKELKNVCLAQSVTMPIVAKIIAFIVPRNRREEKAGRRTQAR